MSQAASEYTPIDDYLEECNELSDWALYNMYREVWLQGLQDHATQGD